MTFLEKLQSGYFNVNTGTSPLNVGGNQGLHGNVVDGDYPEYHQYDELTAENFNVVSKTVDNVVKAHNANMIKIIAALTDIGNEINEKTSVQPDNTTLQINPETGKLEVISVPETTSNKVVMINPETGELVGLTLTQKIKQIDDNLDVINDTITSINDNQYILWYTETGNVEGLSNI